MNVYSLGALIVVWSTLTRTTATIAGFHVPAVWLLVAAVVLALAVLVFAAGPHPHAGPAADGGTFVPSVTRSGGSCSGSGKGLGWDSPGRWVRA